MPDESAAAVKAELAAAVAEAVRGDPWLQEHPPELEWFGFRADSWLEDPASPFVQLVQACAGAAVGRPVEVHARASAVDNRFLPGFGRPTVFLGTRGAGNHGLDEYVAVSSLTPLTVALAQEISALRGARTEVLELRGRTVLPGFNDAHNHMAGFGLQLRMVPLKYPAVRAVPDLEAALRARAATSCTHASCSVHPLSPTPCLPLCRRCPGFLKSTHRRGLDSAVPYQESESVSWVKISARCRYPRSALRRYLAGVFRAQKRGRPPCVGP